MVTKGPKRASDKATYFIVRVDAATTAQIPSGCFVTVESCHPNLRQALEKLSVPRPRTQTLPDIVFLPVTAPVWAQHSALAPTSKPRLVVSAETLNTARRIAGITIEASKKSEYGPDKVAAAEYLQQRQLKPNTRIRRDPRTAMTDGAGTLRDPRLGMPQDKAPPGHINLNGAVDESSLEAQMRYHHQMILSYQAQHPQFQNSSQHQPYVYLSDNGSQQQQPAPNSNGRQSKRRKPLKAPATWPFSPPMLPGPQQHQQQQQYPPSGPWSGPGGYYMNLPQGPEGHHEPNGMGMPPAWGGMQPNSMFRSHMPPEAGHHQGESQQGVPKEGSSPSSENAND